MLTTEATTAAVKELRAVFGARDVLVIAYSGGDFTVSIDSEDAGEDETLKQAKVRQMLATCMCNLLRGDYDKLTRGGE